MYRHIAAAAILFGALSASAVAHHGWGGYTRADFTLTGTIVATHLENPHDRLTVEVNGQMWERGDEPTGPQPTRRVDDSVSRWGIPSPCSVTGTPTTRHWR